MLVKRVVFDLQIHCNQQGPVPTVSEPLNDSLNTLATVVSISLSLHLSEFPDPEPSQPFVALHSTTKLMFTKK